MKFTPHKGLVEGVTYIESPNHDDRPQGEHISALILHSISLPPGHYAGGAANTHPVIQFFQNSLTIDDHPYFAKIAGVKVSSHFFIRRSGEVIQCVPITKRAWHAGESYCAGRTAVNDFSVGIELEGWDEATDGFTEPQYVALQELSELLIESLPQLHSDSVYAHSDIAVGRKCDPGPYFDWSKTLI